MSLKILANKPIKLTRETDLLGTLRKADAIKSILQNYSGQIGGTDQNKMFVLFGEWGSGKSTILEYLKAELPKTGNYTSVIFDTWKNEKDDNLPLSLIYEITRQTNPSDKETLKEILDYAFVFLKGFTKAISVKIGSESIGLDFSNKEVIEEFEKFLKEKQDSKSFSQNHLEFEEQFVRLENLILGEGEEKRLVVFIDDLDRCEPENVLNLLSAIKLFFTYGKRTIFFFAVDKKAVEGAVKTRYNSVINAEDYLEKIFDVSFSMPKMLDTIQIVEQYFKKSNSTESYEAYITKLFVELKFTNPRHLKKVLNKYELLRSFKASNTLNESYKLLIPNILNRNGEGDFLETILTLFLITLFEFYPEKFSEVEGYHGKMNLYGHMGQEYTSGQWQLKDSVLQMYSSFGFSTTEKLTLSDIINKQLRDGSSLDPYMFFIALFTPKKIEKINPHLHATEFLAQFKEDDILLRFCRYLLLNKSVLKYENKSTYRYFNLFEMCKTLL